MIKGLCNISLQQRVILVFEDMQKLFVLFRILFSIFLVSTFSYVQTITQPHISLNHRKLACHSLSHNAKNLLFSLAESQRDQVLLTIVQ